MNWPAAIILCVLAAEPESAIVMTVRGPIPAAELGRALVHEHVLCDFIGAAKTGPHRYDSAKVVEAMRPRLVELKERGFGGFADCTPAYIGRDPAVLRKLSELTGLHILTNTGYYGAAGDKFLPPHAFTESAGQLAERWVTEWRDGIGGTGIKPGFLKIGVDAGPLSEVDRKLALAAARAHLATGLSIACHTGEARAAREVLAAVQEAGAAPAALIVVHADGIRDREVHFELAEAGAWVEYDGVGGRPIEEHVRLIRAMEERGRLDRLLISHDAGWYSAGEADGAPEKIRPFTAIAEKLVPALREAGMEEAAIRRLLEDNPRRAFAVAVRRRENAEEPARRTEE